MKATFPRSIRIWHWLNVIVMLVIALTVFLRETWLNKHNVGDILLAKLAEINITISSDQAITIAKAIRGEMFQWHIYFGIAAAVLIVVRYLMMAKGIKVEEEVTSLHMKMVKLGYKLLYLIILLTTVSGIIGYYGGDLFGIDKAIRHDIMEFHETIAWAILIFIPLHIAGVFVAEQSPEQQGITSKMISG